MKLTEEQLKKIDAILEKFGLDYLDFKLEFKDHIACQVEDIIEKQTLSFEEATFKVLEDWREKLKPSRNSWLINHRRTFPNIVFKKIRNRYLFYYMPVILFALIAGFFPDQIQNWTSSLNTYKTSIDYFTIIIIVIMSIGFLILNWKKQKTSFSGMYNHISYSSFMMGLLILLFQNLFLIGFYFLILSIPFLIYNYRNHQNFIKKFHLV